MDDIPERVVSMCFWAIRDEGTVDEEMVNVILAQEGLLLRESRRTDLTNLLRHFHRFHFATEAPADRQSAHDPTDATLEHVNYVLGNNLRNRQ